MKILDIPRSGSVAGTTSSHNRAGQYVRNRRTPVNSPTARRTLIRTAFAASSSGYSALTTPQQQSWVAAADAHPITDSLGQSIKLTGHQLYVGINTQLQNVGADPSQVPPASFAVFTVALGTTTFSLATGLNITITSNGATTDYILIALSRPVPGGRSFWKTYTQVAAKAGDSTTYTLAAAVYAAQFGTPVLGNKIFIRVTPVNQYGVAGVPLIQSVSVTN